jgi:HAD superfamily hydrolase (TIGR01509 family)
VLIDLYDTLVWSEWPAIRAELEGRIGVSSADLLRAYVTTRPARSVGAYGSMEGDVEALLDAVGVTAEPALVRDLVRRTHEFLRTAVSLHDDSLPVLRELRRRGIGTAVVSNCDHATAPVVRRLGLYEEADEVVLSFEVGVAKPDAGIYELALSRLGVAAADAVFVDDQVDYCDGAAAVGIRSFLVLREDADPMEGVSEPGGHKVIPDLRALLELI